MASGMLALWCALAVAGGPDYDAFSQADGFIAPHQERAAWEMLRDPDRFEAVYADAAKGNQRAAGVVRQLEVTLSASGREIAERVNRPGCLVPVVRELAASCRPDWSFLDFLSQERPGGLRLRTAIFTAFAVRAHELGLENQVILSAANGLLAVGFAAGILRQTKLEIGPSPVPKLPETSTRPGTARVTTSGSSEAAPPPSRPGLAEAANTGPKPLGPSKWRSTGFKPGELDIHFNKHAGEWGAGNLTKEAYLKRAQDILGREPGGEILGHTRANGDILRYNTRTNELAVGAQDGTIRTLFRPKDGLDYWNKQVGP